MPDHSSSACADTHRAPDGPAALIQRLEAAEAGSRELDGAVYRRLLPGSVSRDESPLTDAEYAAILRPPAVTTSLDAALALAERVIKRRGPIDLSVCGSAQVMIHHHDPCGNLLGAAFASTPALALCIAILRARLAADGSASLGEG